ncbi:MAG: cbb3-type cytochrome oxidase assembly protein CcoS [Nitrospirota bacterium]|jgi:cbb3-type cytochrome oxidase maturation protein
MGSVLLLIFLMFCIGFAGWLFFVWAVKSGQYDDVERPKYRMLDDESDEKKEKNDNNDNNDNNGKDD